MTISSRKRFITISTFAYASGALIWIFLSDFLLDSITDLKSIIWLSTAKGILFVIVSTAVFFFALRAVPQSELGHESFMNSIAKGVSPTSIPRWLVYIFAIAITCVTIVVRQYIGVSFEQRPLLLLFMLPIILSALLGGLMPGLLSTILTGLIVDYLFIPPVESFRIAANHDLLQWFMLIAEGIAISLLSELLRQSLSKAEASRELLNTIISGTSDAIFVKDTQGRYLLINKAAAHFVGKPVTDILGHDDRHIFPEASAEKLIAIDRAVIASNQTQTLEEHILTSDQRAMVFLVTKGLIRDKLGKITGLFGISRDITDRKQAELRLQSSEAALQEAQHLAGIGNWEWNLSNNQHFWSQQIYQIYGRDPSLAPAVYPEVQQYFTPESWARLTDVVEHAIANQISYECDAEVVRPDGTHRWITARGKADKDINGKTIRLHGTVQDITERKLVMLMLEENEERLRLAIDATSDGLWDWDLRSNVVYRTPHYYDVTGYSAEDDTHDFQFLQRIVHPEDLTYVLQTIHAHQRGETPFIDVDFRVLRKNGDIRWVKSRGKVVYRDEQGAPCRMVGTLSDITNYKRTNDDLRFVLNEAGDAIWIANNGGEFIFANPAACHLTGHSMDNIQAMHIPQLIHTSLHDELTAHLQLLNQEKFIRREWLLQCKNGSTVPVELTTERMQDGRYMAFGRDLTEKKRADLILQEKEQQLERVIAGSDQGFWDWNLVTNAFHTSNSLKTMLGYEPEELDLSVDQWGKHVHPDDLKLSMASLEKHIAGLTPNHIVEMRCRTKSGEWCWVQSRGRIVSWNADGTPLMMSGTHTNITERKYFELAQRDASTVFASSYEGIMVVAPDGLITKINPAFTRITGYAAEEIIGQSPNILASGRHHADFYAEMWRSLQEHDFWRGEIWNRRKNGELFAEILSISAVRNEANLVEHYIGVFSDISQLKAHEEELMRIAHYDPLTGSPNRRLLADRLQQAIVHASRNATSLAVCFLDLDGFKAINDQYGHNAGDKLLIGVTHHLKEVMRAQETLARLGGDEFVLLLSDICTPEECSKVLDRILHAVSLPVRIDDDIDVCVSASIGVSLYPEDNVDADSLLRHADQAMYMAKEAGKNRYHMFDQESDRKAQIHRNYLDILRKALENEEFRLFYQPKVDLLSGDIVSVEALIRWQHPERGLLPPSEFLPHIYGSNLEQPLGNWVISHALAQAEMWHRMGLSISVSVNVSADHLLQPNFYTQLQQVLAQHPDVPASHFELEVLETAAIADMEQAVSILRLCRELGVHFALDDFGTGYSSLTYLRKLPVDTLKIDQSFVRDMLNDADDFGIVEGVIQLAKAFNRTVVAEGVETMEHGAALMKIGCHLAQGYGIARPMPAVDFFAWSEKWKREASWSALHSLKLITSDTDV
ncbi:PAS domain S-box protein [Undibacterium sp. SXout7W]|uniref:PAS domain S-box protein n=1 Tax=Undibacterium sp. SXout7W TaxID=3413049 RepID=UPI003BF00D15